MECWGRVKRGQSSGVFFLKPKEIGLPIDGFLRVLCTVHLAPDIVPSLISHPPVHPSRVALARQSGGRAQSPVVFDMQSMACRRSSLCFVSISLVSPQREREKKKRALEGREEMLPRLCIRRRRSDYPL